MTAPSGSLMTEALEVLLECADRDRALTVEELTRRLPVDPDHLEAAVDRLVEDGTVVAVGEAIALSEDGRSRAYVSVRRHRLAERMLCDMLGLDWWKVHSEAERWEGVITDEVEQRLVEVLGDPGTCPHGNPIPGSANQSVHPDAVLLADAPAGPVYVVRVTETLEGDPEALQLLQRCGFTPGRDAEVQDRHDGWVLVAGAVQDAALPPHVAAHTYVAPR